MDNPVVGYFNAFHLRALKTISAGFLDQRHTLKTLSTPELDDGLSMLTYTILKLDGIIQYNIISLRLSTVYPQTGGP